MKAIKFMKSRNSLTAFRNQSFCIPTAVGCVASLSFSPSMVLGQAQAPQAQSQVMTNTTSADAGEAPKIPNDQIDSLVAPIALYPDPLLAQTMAASTYPLEIIQLQQWME